MTYLSISAEKDKKALADLQREKEKLDKVIQQKELEQKLLESQLNDTKTENVKQKEDMLKIKEDILHNFADLMETELQCAICSELFIFVSIFVVLRQTYARLKFRKVIISRSSFAVFCSFKWYISLLTVL